MSVILNLPSVAVGTASKAVWPSLSTALTFITLLSSNNSIIFSFPAQAKLSYSEIQFLDRPRDDYSRAINFEFMEGFKNQTKTDIEIHENDIFFMEKWKLFFISWKI